VLSVKFGLMRSPDGGIVGNDLRPPAVKNFLAYTLRRLRTDYVDVYRPGRVFPDVPIEETVGAIAELVQAGYVRHVGLSEVGAETVRRAHAVHPISDLQIEYSLLSRGIEHEILPACRELDVVPLVGARRRERFAEALAALDVELRADDLAQIEAAIPADAAAGECYQAEQMAILDSERG